MRPTKLFGSLMETAKDESLRCPRSLNRTVNKFFFYSNEHRPIHVHVRHGDGEAVFNVEESVELRESQDMKVSELSKAQQLAEENRQLILEKWHEHLG